MAQFRGTIKGNRGEVSRLGSKVSGMSISCDGWDVGVDCVAEYDKKLGQDVITIFGTGGSNKSSNTKIIATLTKHGIQFHNNSW